MTNKKMIQPKDASETEASSHLNVPKELYDLMRLRSVDFIPAIHFTVYDFLDIFPMSELLNEEGVNAVEQCLEHVAYACLLPIEVNGKSSEGLTTFKLRNEPKENS